MALNALSLSVAVGYTGYSFKSAVVGLTAGSEVEMRRGFGDGFGYSNGFVRSEGLPTPDSWFELVEYLPATGERRVSRLDVASRRYDIDAQAAFTSNPSATSVSPAPITSLDGSKTWGVALRGPGGTSIVNPGGVEMLLKYPNFPKKVKRLRALTDISNYNTDATRLAIVAEPDSIDGRNVISMKVNGTYNTTDFRFSLGAQPWDMRNGVIGLWAKKMSDVLTIWVDLWSAGTPAAPTANYSTFAYDQSTFAEAYDSFVFCQMGEHSSRLTATGTGCDISAVTHGRVRVGPGDGSATECRIGDFSFTPNPRTRPAVILKSADAFNDPFTVVRPKAQAAGVTIPWFLTPGAVDSSNGYNRGGGNRLTTAQVNTLRAEGTQSGTQAWKTEAAQPDYASYIIEYTGMREYNRTYGWYADAADDSFHSGVNAGSPNSRAAKIATGARTIQRFKNNAVKNTLPPMLRPETFPFRDRMSHVTMNIAVLGSGTQPAVAQVESHINEAIKITGVAELSVHGNLLNNQNSLDIIDYLINRKKTVNDFDFHTPSSILNEWLALYGPSEPYEFPYSMKQVA